MFRDAKEELKRLEAELLAEEEREEAQRREAAAEKARREEGVRFFDDAAYDTEEYGEYGEYDEYGEEDEYGGAYDTGPRRNATGRNSDEADVDLEEYGDTVYQGKTRGITRLVILAMLLIAAIFALLAYNVKRYGL